MTEMGGQRRGHWWTGRPATLLVVLVLAAAGGWLGAELHDRATGDDPAGPPAGAERGGDEQPDDVATPRPRGMALSSAAVRTVVDSARRSLAPGARLQGSLPDAVTAVAVEVTVTDARRAGKVRLDGGAGPTVALNVAEAGVTTSNLVVLPVAGRTLSIDHGPGGGLEVRTVATFAAPPTTGAGQFVARPALRVAHLDTAQDGRELTIDPATYGAAPGIRAVLVLVSAEVGEVPARLLIGTSPEGRTERMAWGGAKVGTPAQRRGLAIVPVDASGAFSLRYEHGTALDVDVLGFFTGPGTQARNGALLVPGPVRTAYDGVVPAGGTDVRVPGDATGALLSLAADPGVTGDLPPTDVAIASGRTLSVVVGAAKGRVRLDASQRLRARVDLLAYFTRDTSTGPAP